jgi:hypothetical protein
MRPARVLPCTITTPCCAYTCTPAVTLPSQLRRHPSQRECPAIVGEHVRAKGTCKVERMSSRRALSRRASFSSPTCAAPTRNETGVPLEVLTRWRKHGMREIQWHERTSSGRVRAQRIAEGNHTRIGRLLAYQRRYWYHASMDDLPSRCEQKLCGSVNRRTGDFRGDLFVQSSNAVC